MDKLDENFSKKMYDIIRTSTEIGMRIGKGTSDRNADLELEKMKAFYNCWVMFGLVRKTIGKITKKRKVSITKINEAIEALHGKLAKANDMDSLREIMEDLEKGL